MKSFLFLVLLVQFSFIAISVAQITFTREWVTGKRSPVPKVKVVAHEEDFCKSLIPAMDYLLEAEKARERVCGPPPKMAIPNSFVWNRPLQCNEVPLIPNSDQPIIETSNSEGDFTGRIRKST